MGLIFSVLLIVAGLLGASSLIVAKKPDARQMLDKLVPYQAIIGVALLAIGLWNARHIIDAFRIISVAPLLGLTAVGSIVSSVLLGFMFGMPQIAKWAPGEGAAEQKGMELSRKLAPFQLILGIVALASGLLSLLYELRILKIG